MVCFGISSFKCIRHSKVDTFLCQLLFNRNIVTKPISASRFFIASSVGRDLSFMRSFHNSRDSWRSFEGSAFDCNSKAPNNIVFSSSVYISTCQRTYTTVLTQQTAEVFSNAPVNPYILVEDQLKNFYEDIRQILRESTSRIELETIGTYYLSGEGKALRPMVTMLMAKAINYHLKKESRLKISMQRQIALFSEMIHAASLMQDDVIDQANSRRGKPSANELFNHKRVTLAADYVLSVAMVISARFKNDDVTILLNQIVADAVEGEFMQLSTEETENERFAQYFKKSYLKTASLLGNTFHAVAVIADVDDHIYKIAFEYGRNIGLAYQFIDDMLDFVASTKAMGKPTASDLKHGLATAPVFFTREKFPELNRMIARRFKEPGDVQRTFDLVHKSNGLERTKFLAKKHCDEAIRLVPELTDSPYQKALEVIADYILNRVK